MSENEGCGKHDRVGSIFGRAPVDGGEKAAYRKGLGSVDGPQAGDGLIVRGCSSVVERHVANVNVVSSNLITRF